MHRAAAGHQWISRIAVSLILLTAASACGQEPEETAVDTRAVEKVCPDMGIEPLVELTQVRPELVRQARVVKGIHICRGVYPEEELPADGVVLEGEQNPEIPGGGALAFEVVREGPQAPFQLGVGAPCFNEPALIRNQHVEFHACPVESDTLVLEAAMTCLATGATWGWEVHLSSREGAPSDMRAEMSRWVPETCT